LGGDSNGTGSPNWSVPGKFGGAGIAFDGTDGKFLLSTGLPQDEQAVTLSFWVYPESSDFHLFSLTGTAPAMSISLRNQRPVFSLDGLGQQSLPGTAVDEFWAKGYLPLNQWSHLALTFDLGERMVRFYLDGQLDNESSFSSNQLFPLSQAFRLGPQDGTEATATIGKVDDFRVYEAALSGSEISRLFGGGSGDFYQRTIEVTQISGYQSPEKVTVRFLQDGFPVSVDGFDSADYSPVTNGSGSAPSMIAPGVYELELTPTNPAVP
ncbi:uncharacterized protein METZ01_LOCUS432778, partial [marine metagenome]